MKNNLFKAIFLLSLTIFVASYFIEETGYYDYKLQEKTILTNEQIKKFEEDIKNGKEVDIESYLKENEKDYSNNITTNITKVSLTTNKYLKKGIESIFGILNNFVKD